MNAPRPDDDEQTGLPGVRRWRTVYIAVAVIFTTWIVLLTVLTQHYS